MELGLDERVPVLERRLPDQDRRALRLDDHVDERRGGEVDVVAGDLLGEEEELDLVERDVEHDERVVRGERLAGHDPPPAVGSSPDPCAFIGSGVFACAAGASSAAATASRTTRRSRGIAAMIRYSTRRFKAT